MEWLLSQADRDLRARVRGFVERELRPIAAEADENDSIPWEVVARLRQEGLFRLVFPAQYGGVEGAPRCVVTCIVREELSRVCMQADSIFAMQGIASYPLLVGGSEEQKAKYLPTMAAGEGLAGFALTEPHAGSDAAAVQTTAVRDGDGYLLNGMKRFISNAPEAMVYTVFAKTDPSAGVKGLSAFLVQKGTAGLVLGRNHRLIAAHATGELILDSCRVPASSLIGEPNRAFKLAMATLDMYRTTVGAAAVGLARTALELAAKYARARVQFGNPLASTQAIQFKIADMAVELDASRLLVYRAALAKDSGQPSATKYASMAKLFASEAAGRIADQCVQIHGAIGLDKTFPVERLYRQVRGMRIYEGASEIQRIVIARQVLSETEDSGAMAW